MTWPILTHDSLTLSNKTSFLEFTPQKETQHEYMFSTTLFSFYVFGQEHERVAIFLDIPMSWTMSYLTCDLKLKVTSVIRLLTCWTMFLQLTTIHDLSEENHSKTSFSRSHGEKVMLHFVWPLRRRNKDSWLHWQIKNLATIPVWPWILFTKRFLLTRLLK